MPGMVVTVKVEDDQVVKRGEPLLILEAMKMENQLRSPVEGRILKVAVSQGQKVEKGEKLIIIGLQKS
jgi:biotin carboxyl carrier protein